jgi:hypothetical protein
MTALILAILCLVTLAAVFAIELPKRRRRVKPVKLPRTARVRSRQPQLEDVVRGVLGELKDTFGDIFASVEVWKIDRETRVSLHATPMWKRLSVLTRNRIVRHVWQSVAAIVDAVIVFVDNPPQRWTRQDERTCALVPLTADGFRAPVAAPQFIRDG